MGIRYILPPLLHHSTQQRASPQLRRSAAGFTDSERAEVATYALEARFMRAFTYWWVLDLFGKGPFVDENSPLTGFIPEAYDGTPAL